MRSVYTPVGILEIKDGFDKEKLSAELRGLDLLFEIISKSPNWRIDNFGTRPFIRSNDGSPEIQIDIFTCILNKICRDNNHLSIQMSMRNVCVLTDFAANEEIPSTDAIISIVLLGNSGWPVKHTPDTLEEKSIGYYKETCEIDGLKDTNIGFEDFDQLETCKNYADGKMYREALIELGKLSRYLYVCKMLTIESIVQFISPVLGTIPRELVSRYLLAPDEEYDGIFLSPRVKDNHQVLPISTA